tara:strand:+ start:877 stop:1653 length:777 start_codon:yes stop_codon:yes gene_type:complete
MHDTKKLQYRICELASKSGEGHVPSALSILDIVWVIYDKFMNLNNIKNQNLNREHFILSKGHASLAQYVVLEKKGIIKKNKLDTYLSYNSDFGGHPDSNKVKGVEASTGSLGHGMPIAAGISYAKILLKIKSRVFCIVGDGECNEGTIWETCLIASNHNLNNLVCIIDKNKSTDRAIKIDDIKKKFLSFNWNVVTIDGHNQKNLIKVLKKKTSKPLAIIAKTIKGKGVKFMELNQHEWHHKKIDDTVLKKIKTKIFKK